MRWLTLGGLFVIAMLVAAPPAFGLCANPNEPLQVTLKFKDAPANVTFAAATPIQIVLQVENCSGNPVLTTDKFSSTDFFRRLYFTDPNGGTIINKAEETLHAFNETFYCHSRNDVLQPTTIPVVPVEVLVGPQGEPTVSRFFREFVIDPRTLYDLTLPGHYSVNARIELVTFNTSFTAAAFSDCDQLPGTTVVNVGAVSGRQGFSIVSNTLDFIIAGPVAATSSITGRSPVAANGIVASTVTITLRDASGVPVPGVTPTFSATGSNNTLSDCSATNPSGVSTCSLKSTKAEIKTLAIVTPVAKTGGTVTFTVGALDHLVISPATSTIAAGGTQFYTAEGFDASNNSLGDLTGATTFTITPNGSCSAASCTAPASPALHTVKGTSGGKTSPEASLTVAASADLVRVWVGLFTSADVGIRFDLRAIVRKNGSPISSGQLGSVSGGSSGFNNATLYTIPLIGTPVPASSGTLSVEVLVRNACVASGKDSGRAQLWFNGAKVDTGATRDAGSRLDPPSGTDPTLYFLRSGNPLSLGTAGLTRTSVDKLVGAKCGPYQSFGTWSITTP